VPITSGKFPSNWELSTARAVSVVTFLQEMGVNPAYLAAAGYGEYNPAADNTSEDGKAQNRRIEITLMPNLNELPDLSDLEKELQ
jgi:chemotaxis protein MotB